MNCRFIGRSLAAIFKQLQILRSVQTILKQFYGQTKRQLRRLQSLLSECKADPFTLIYSILNTVDTTVGSPHLCGSVWGFMLVPYHVSSILLIAY